MTAVTILLALSNPNVLGGLGSIILYSYPVEPRTISLTFSEKGSSGKALDLEITIATLRAKKDIKKYSWLSPYLCITI